jgi:hypothetical protein
MTGDPEDMQSRLLAVLPAHWFADASTVLNGVVAGLAAGWAALYEQLSFAKLQTRIATATDRWLDWIAQDYFGSRLQRFTLEPDSALRVRIQKELLRERGTRSAVVSALTDLTGRTPAVFEPARATDTGAWGQALAYGRAGGWGSLALPFQCFVTAFRPNSSGIATVAGYGTAGPLEYANLSMIQGQVTDADILAAVADVVPVAAIAWTRISN